MKNLLMKYLERKSNRMFLYASIWAIIAAVITIFIEPKMKLLFLAAIGYTVKGFIFQYFELNKIRKPIK